MSLPPFVDTHHHLWDLSTNYYPWLTDRVVVKPYGDYAAIRRNYLIEDFIADVGDLPLAKSVHLNGGHDRSDPVRETRWLQAIADDGARSGGLPNGVVVDADLSSTGAGAELDAHCACSNVRGVRAILSDGVRYPGQHPDLTEDRLWRENLSLLETFGLSLDLQLYPQQMAPIAALAKRHPDVLFIVCHLGLPEDRSPDGRVQWRDAIRLLASEPNAVMKISGFGLVDQQWTAESIRPLVLEAIDIFGVERCLLGSNFPVDKLFATYATLWRSLDRILSGFSDSERRLLFHDNALRVYRI